MSEIDAHMIPLISPSILSWPLLAGGVLVVLGASPVAAATCPFVGEPRFGIEPPLAIDATCIDPDYNAQTLVIEATEQKTLTLPDGVTIPYTEVRGHFPATRTTEQLPSGVSQSPTTAKHGVTWRFPAKAYWRNRFFQQSYPLTFDENLNTADPRFAFTSGGYTVGITPGSPNVGYRVSAAAAKLAKLRANELYGNTRRIYGYAWGQSGGSVQMMGANEGTTGVWDGIVPVVIATDGLNTHSFQWDGHYALAVPESKRQAIAEAVAPGSGRDIYAGLTGDERAALDELLSAGFARIALADWKFTVAMAIQGAVATYDPSYEDDFWSKPGYEGVNPPAYLSAADGLKAPTVARHLSADGKDRAEVGVNQPVQLVGRIEMPPGAGKVVQYDWYLGRADFAFEPVTRLAKPQAQVEVTRTVSFPEPGEYTITLRVSAQRNGQPSPTRPTLLNNLARVRVAVR